MTKPELAHQYRYDIEKLRGIAVALVVIYHIWPDGLLRQFFVGVDIFFVISGYVIAQTVYKVSSRKDRDCLTWKKVIARFMQDRVRRIMPPLVVCVAICSLIGFLFIRPESYAYSVSVRTGALSLVGASNIYLAKIASNYFSVNAQQNLFENTWSLGVELQFYAAIIMLWVLLEGIKSRNGEYWRKLFVFFIAAVSIAVGIAEAKSYYSFVGRIWQFGVGVGCYTLCRRYSLGERRLHLEGLYARYEGLLVSTFLAVFLVAFRDYPQIVVRACVCLLIAAKLVFLPGTRPETWFSTFRYLGKRSYSIYLYHWPILFMAKYIWA